MEILISGTPEELGKRAASKGAELIREAVAERGEAAIIVATGTSQLQMLEALVKEDVDWTKVTSFHLDEYIGISETHPASFRKYLRERFAGKVPLKLFNYVNGDNDPVNECIRLGSIIREYIIDVAFIGIGENGHIAFNDPPADFETDDPFVVVDLDDACRRQQLGEGWFRSFDDVPDKAISMSVRQILKSNSIICTVPDRRKAEAVRRTIKEDISPLVPASVLRKHGSVWLYLDRNSSSML